MVSSIAKGACCCGISCLCLSIIGVGLSFGINIMILLSRDYVEMLPGDSVRRSLQTQIVEAMRSGDFAKVEEAYERPDSALLLGDASGVRWKQENGFSLDEAVPVASQSKIIAALAIYGLMSQDDGATLDLDSKPSDFFTSWPKPSAPGGNVTLAHLLAFTTGFQFTEEQGCARTDASMDHPADHWPTCIAEIGRMKFDFAPGTSFLYGPWHLYVAAGMAMKAFEKPLTAEAWLEVVQSKVFTPSGITEKVRYEPFSFNPFEKVGRQVPNFAGGMVMSAQQLGKIMRTLQFGNLLPDPWKERFLSAEYGANITRSNSWEQALQMGQWRYAQGHWIACDAAAEQNLDVQNISAAKQLCSNLSPEIHHSVGAFGAYAWMDVTNNVFGVYIQNWLVTAKANNALGITLSSVFAVVLSVAAGFLCYWCASKGTSRE